MVAVSLLFLYTIPLLVVLHICSAHLLRKLQNGPPTPFPCLPIIGHLYLLKEPIHATLDRLANRYGPVYSIQLGSRRLLMVSSPSAAQECLDKNDTVFANRPSGFMVGKYIGHNYSSPIWASYGAYWRDTRRILAIGLVSSNRLRQLSLVGADEVKQLVRRLKKNIEVSDVVEIKSLLYDLTMNVITRMIFGKSYYTYGEESLEGNNNSDIAKRFRKMMEKCLELCYENYVGDMVPSLRWLDWLKETSFKKFIEETDTLMQELIKEHSRKLVVSMMMMMMGIRENP